jgi:hypothetical protein
MLNKHKHLRWFLVIACSVVAIATFPLPVYWIWSHVQDFVPFDKVQPIEWSDAAKLSIEKRLELSTQLFQAALILLGAVWGFVVVKPADAAIVLKDAQERCLLLVATLALAGSLYAHISVVELMSHYALMASTSKHLPDLDHPNVSYVLFAQYLATLAGSLIAAVVVVSAKWLRGDRI